MNPMIYDENGNSINYFFQWDLNRKIRIDMGNVNLSNIPEVHFDNKMIQDGYMTRPTVSGKYLIVEVPNILLQVAVPIRIYVYWNDPNNNASVKTIWAAVVPIRKRVMPPTYIYNDNTVYMDVLKMRDDITDLQTEVADIERRLDNQ